MLRGPDSCFTLAMIGMAGILITAALFVMSGVMNGPTEDRTPGAPSVTIEEIAAKLKQEPETVRTWFDERRLNVTGFVEGRRRREDGSPVLLLAMPEERLARATLEAGSASKFSRVRKGERVSVHCDSIRVVGVQNPYLDLRGCSFV